MMISPLIDILDIARMLLLIRESSIPFSFSLVIGGKTARLDYLDKSRRSPGLSRPAADFGLSIELPKV